MIGVYDVFNDFSESKSLGGAELRKFEVDQKASFGTQMRAILNSFAWEACSPGKYVKLYVDGELMMSDTDMEKDSNYEVVQKAHGDVMLAGLGIGLLLHNLRDKVQKGIVSSITVYEKSQDVINLVSPYYRDIPNLRIVCQDILTYKPRKDECYDCIYFDIWPTIDYECNLPEIRALHNRWKFHKKNKEAYMNSWMKEFMQDRKRKDNRVW